MPHRPFLRQTRLLLLALAALACACGEVSAPDAAPRGGPTALDEHAHCDSPPEQPNATGFGTLAGALSSISCGTSTATGYKSGNAFTITLVTVDSKPVEVGTANAYFVMAQAAAKSGINLKVVSGFRTMAEQQYLYNCYKSKKCNNGNLAAAPGYSNHQSGHALDLNTSTAGVFNWLVKNGGSYGFKKTVPSENWHWEWWGGGPGGGPCGCSGGCNDGNPCTNDTCQSAKCAHSFNNNGCNDGNGCTVNDHCQGGKCQGGAALACNDGNPCTDDSCQGGKCVAAANNAPCSDGNACTLGDTCAGAACAAGKPLNCDDGDPCIVGEACAAGACVAGKPVLCDDGNPCTDDACAGGQCVAPPNAAPCSDGDACTTGDLCALGICLHGTPVTCNDANPCTSDICSAAVGCEYPPSEGSCDDGDGCTQGDYCAMALCLSGANLACDDGLPCTVDGCEDGACAHVGEVKPAAKACVDGDVVWTDACGGAPTLVEACPEAAPCADGECKAAGSRADAASGSGDAGPDDAQPGPGAGDTDGGAAADGLATLEAKGAAGAGAANQNADNRGDAGGCQTTRAAATTPVSWLLLLAGLLLAVRRVQFARRRPLQPVAPIA